MHASHQTTDYPKTTKSVLTQSCIKQNIHKHQQQHFFFEEIVPSGSPLLKKHIALGHAGIVDHSVDLSIPDFVKSIKNKSNGQEAIKHLKYYINA